MIPTLIRRLTASQQRALLGFLQTCAMYGVLWAMIASAGAVFAETPEQQAMYLAQSFRQGTVKLPRPPALVGCPTYNNVDRIHRLPWNPRRNDPRKVQHFRIFGPSSRNPTPIC